MMLVSKLIGHWNIWFVPRIEPESWRSIGLLQVATFRKTRHENLVLFMGACMKPPRLAIVTSLCKGMTLYTHIHLRKDKFTANKSVIVAQQISQVPSTHFTF